MPALENQRPLTAVVVQLHPDRPFAEPSLFDPPAGPDPDQDALFDADAAVDRGTESAAPDWRAAFMDAIKRHAEIIDYFTASQVVNRYSGPETHDMRAVGGAMRSAAAKGWIVATQDYWNTGSHGRPQRVWRSLIYNYEPGQ